MCSLPKQLGKHVVAVLCIVYYTVNLVSEQLAIIGIFTDRNNNCVLIRQVKYYNILLILRIQRKKSPF